MQENIALIGNCQRELVVIAFVLLTWLAGGDSAPRSLWADEGAPETSHGAPVTDAAWWKENRKRAVFVPGKGYTVEGVPGFFDEMGHPIGGPVRRATFDAAPSQRIDVTLPDAVLGKSAEKKPGLTDRLLALVGRRHDPGKAKRLFHEAEDLFQRRQFAAAARKYKRAIKQSPDSQIEQDAMFMLGESYFFADHYPQAVDAYDALLKKYPGTRRLDDVVVREFSIALYWQKYADAKPQWPLTPNVFDKTRRGFDTFGHALKVYENIRLNDPTGPRADDALMATGTAYFLRGRYEDADYQFDLLRREYPKSEHQFEAHLLGLQCKLRKYQGPDYDGKALDEANKLIKQLLVQFPDKVNAERDRVTKLRAEVAAQQALRNWKMAEYYAKGHHYGAAKHYYQELIDAHPETKLAEQARTQLAKIGGLPDNPTQRLKWLVNLFPDSDSMTAIAKAPDGDTTRR